MRIRDSQSDPYDFCPDCFPSEAEALDEYGDNGDGPDGRGNCFCYDDEHPGYDCDEYTCHTCGRQLEPGD
jgi:hypothetical protein